MKKFINDASNVLIEDLRGVQAAHPELRVDLDTRVIYRGEPTRAGKVALLSGGGSGHEPMHGGFVGVGMLDAACAGEVFTSPTPDQILAATQGADSGAGVLHIVKNYTGDVMNFEMAAELAAATGVRVESVVVADDVAVEDSTWTAGRRGVGTTVVLEKVVGALAEEGADLDAVAAYARQVAESGRSMGVALTSCTVPAAGKPTFELPDDEMEVGVGIHGEPGRHREKIASAHEIAGWIVDPIVHDFGDGIPQDAIVLISGLGGTPEIELYLLYGEIEPRLRAAGINPARVLIGDYITSLDMAGASLTIVPADAETLRLWDAPVVTPGLRWGA